MYNVTFCNIQDFGKYVMKAPDDEVKRGYFT
jgi:hypothetical protein